jgi:hypothetical protein
VVSKDSSIVILGRIPGSLFASMLLPEPGGPIIRIVRTLVPAGKSGSFLKIKEPLRPNICILFDSSYLFAFKLVRDFFAKGT